jgi:hypothetical protein
LTSYKDILGDSDNQRLGHHNINPTKYERLYHCLNDSHALARRSLGFAPNSNVVVSSIHSIRLKDLPNFTEPAIVVLNVLL